MVVDKLLNGCDSCWMKRTPFYFAFLLPVAAVILINIIIYCIIVVTLCRRPNLGRQQKNANSNFILNVRASVGAFVVLGEFCSYDYVHVA